MKKLLRKVIYYFLSCSIESSVELRYHFFKSSNTLVINKLGGAGIKF